jgi:hypothetical protein
LPWSPPTFEPFSNSIEGVFFKHLHQLLPSTPFVNGVIISYTIFTTLNLNCSSTTQINQCVASLALNEQFDLLLQIMSQLSQPLKFVFSIEVVIKKKHSNAKMMNCHVDFSTRLVHCLHGFFQGFITSIPICSYPRSWGIGIWALFSYKKSRIV